MACGRAFIRKGPSNAVPWPLLNVPWFVVSSLFIDNQPQHSPTLGTALGCV